MVAENPSLPAPGVTAPPAAMPASPSTETQSNGGASTTLPAPPSAASPTASQTEPTPSKVEPAACGRVPGENAEKVRWRHGNNTECDRLETVWANVPQADLACKTDADCTVVTSDGNCINLPISKKAAARKTYQRAPCGNPASGACAGHRNVPKCHEGCCRVE
jgi:hypothetical protein